MSEETKVVVIGDTHGDYSFHAKRAVPLALEVGAKEIWSVGDWGYWGHTKEGDRFLFRVNELLKANDLVLRWVPGNHENWDYLETIYENEMGTPHPIEIRSRIWYLPAGTKFRYGGRTILCCGGAASIDKQYRLNEMRKGGPASWWPNEMISDKDVGRCRSAGRADILLSHDAPGFYDLNTHKRSTFPATVENRERLTKVLFHCKPQLVLHGHWHYYYERDFTEADCRVVGLDCSTPDEHVRHQARPYGVLSLPSMEFDAVPWTYTPKAKAA